MNLNLDSHTLELSCPGCSKKFKETIGRLKNNPDIPCPGCGATIHIEADQLRNGIQAIQDYLASFGRRN